MILSAAIRSAVKGNLVILPLKRVIPPNPISKSKCTATEMRKTSTMVRLKKVFQSLPAR